MKDQSKTKQGLIQELDSLEQRIADLERSESDRKQMEEVLRESIETTKALLNNPTDVIGLVDANGIILDINTSGAERFRKPVE